MMDNEQFKEYEARIGVNNFYQAKWEIFIQHNFLSLESFSSSIFPKL